MFPELSVIVSTICCVTFPVTGSCLVIISTFCSGGTSVTTLYTFPVSGSVTVLITFCMGSPELGSIDVMIWTVVSVKD